MLPRRLLLLFTATLLCLPLRAGAVEGTQGGKVGLVLSGGGAKGIAEIGVIKALEENDIPIDYIAGTSMGAIVGSLYACGYSPEEMMNLVTSKMFLDASTGTIDPENYYLFFTPQQNPSMVSLRFSTDSIHRSRLLPSSLISPMPMNYSFMSIFAGYTAQCGGDFNRLFVPLRTVASDMTHKHKKVFSSGPLSDAVRSSMSFPIVFKPVKVDGALMYDGGIYDNFPVDVMNEEFSPDFMIGVDVHETDTLRAFPDIMQQLNMIVIRSTNNYNLPDSLGVKIRVDVNRFSLLDFAKADEIYDAGYKRGLEFVDSIKGRLLARRPQQEVEQRRARFKAAARPIVFDSVSVTGASPSENTFIKYIFDSTGADTLNLNSALDSYNKVLSTGMFNDLDPKAVYNPATGRFSLDLEAEVKNNLDLSLGGYVSSSVNSMLFVSVGYRSLDFRSIDASVSGWIGQSYMAGQLDSRAMLRKHTNSDLRLRVAVWRQKFYESDKLFYEDDSPAFITHLETFLRPQFSFATGRSSIGAFGIGYGHINDKYYNNDASIVDRNTTRNTTIQDLGQLFLSWTSTTLNNSQLPTKGRSIAILGQGLIGKYSYTPGQPIARTISSKLSDHEKWLQLEVQYRKYFTVAQKFSLGVESTTLLSTRGLMPNYNASIVNAPAFNPTPSSYNIFNPRLRAGSFVTAGLVPVYQLNDRIEFRGSFHCFLPVRPILPGEQGCARHGHWFSHGAFFGEISGSIKLPFANLSVYANYQDCPGDSWSIGISLGHFILASKFLRL